ncbi:MAG: RNA-binding S4 domain-containing protein [Actinomycetota bacterium]|nr:RNA-binding S4 domain-containing protein [Actinomycetota bacterium]
MDRVEDLPVGVQGIRLGQLLKLVGVADTGGAAKQLLCEGLVSVNGHPEVRRGAHLSAGDVVSCGDQRWRVR